LNSVDRGEFPVSASWFVMPRAPALRQKWLLSLFLHRRYLATTEFSSPVAVSVNHPGVYLTPVALWQVSPADCHWPVSLVASAVERKIFRYPVASGCERFYLRLSACSASGNYLK